LQISLFILVENCAIICLLDPSGSLSSVPTKEIQREVNMFFPFL
jgi:hypothetical protein